MTGPRSRAPAFDLGDVQGDEQDPPERVLIDLTPWHDVQEVELRADIMALADDSTCDIGQIRTLSSLFSRLGSWPLGSVTRPGRPHSLGNSSCTIRPHRPDWDRRAAPDRVY